MLPQTDSDALEFCPSPARKLLAVQAFLNKKISEGQLAILLRCQRIEARAVVLQCTELENGITPPLTLPFGRSLLKATLQPSAL